MAQAKAKSAINFAGSGTRPRVKNPQVSKLEAKIEDLKAQIRKDSAMLPQKYAEIKAEIEKAEWELKSEPQTIEVKDSEMPFSPTNVDMSVYDNFPTIDYMA